jgi:Arc/MetJ-type ribon-helix-helix transcriptional regulator
MTAKRPLTIDLNDLDEESRRIIDRLIAEGRHRTADEVIAEALDRYQEALAEEALARAMSAPVHGDYRQATITPKGGPS